MLDEGRHSALCCITICGPLKVFQPLWCIVRIKHVFLVTLLWTIRDERSWITVIIVRGAGRAFIRNKCFIDFETGLFSFSYQHLSNYITNVINMIWKQIIQIWSIENAVQFGERIFFGCIFIADRYSEQSVLSDSKLAIIFPITDFTLDVALVI